MNHDKLTPQRFTCSKPCDNLYCQMKYEFFYLIHSKFFYALNCCENDEYHLKKCDTLYSGEEVPVFQRKILLASSGKKVHDQENPVR